MTSPDSLQPDPSQWLLDFGDSMFQYARARLGDDHLAEDVVQETLIKAYGAFHQFRGDSSLRTWLFQILRNEVFRHFRQANRKRQISTADQSVDIEQLLSPTLSNQLFRTELEKKEFWQEVRLCCQKLPDHLQAVFLAKLTRPDDKIDNLCESLDITASHFSVRLYRARLLLRQCLESGWLSDEGGVE